MSFDEVSTQCSSGGFYMSSVSNVWFSSDVAVPMQEAAKPLISEGFRRGVILRGKSNIFDLWCCVFFANRVVSAASHGASCVKCQCAWQAQGCSALYTPRFTLRTLHLRLTLHMLQPTLYTGHPMLQFTIYTWHFAPYTLHFALPN